MPVIRLRSSEGKVIVTNTDVVKCSGTIGVLLDNFGTHDEEAIIPLPKVHSATLGLILFWAEHHRKGPQLTEDDIKRMKAAKKIPEWDTEFLKMDIDDLCLLLTAANYLDIKPLVYFTAFAIASRMKGRTGAQLRAEFRLPNDLAEREQEMIRREDEYFANCMNLDRADLGQLE